MVCIWYLDASTFELDGSALPREEDSEESERFEESSCACWRVVEEPQEEEEEEEQEVEGKEVEVEEKGGLEEGRRYLLSLVEFELTERSRGNSWRKQQNFIGIILITLNDDIWNISWKMGLFRGLVNDQKEDEINTVLVKLMIMGNDNEGEKINMPE